MLFDYFRCWKLSLLYFRQFSRKRNLFRQTKQKKAFSFHSFVHTTVWGNKQSQRELWSYICLACALCRDLLYICQRAGARVQIYFAFACHDKHDFNGRSCLKKIFGAAALFFLCNSNTPFGSSIVREVHKYEYVSILLTFLSMISLRDCNQPGAAAGHSPDLLHSSKVDHEGAQVHLQEKVSNSCCLHNMLVLVMVH